MKKREPDTYFVMYMSTAALTGVFIVGMLLTSPRSLLEGQITVAVLAIIVMFGTLPFRKGIAIGWDIYVERKTSGD